MTRSNFEEQLFMETTNNSSRRKVVIIGGGFGGLYAAKALANQPVDVTMIDRTNHHLFQPLLYQVATAGLSPGDIAQPIRHILCEAQNISVLMAGVETIRSDQSPSFSAVIVSGRYRRPLSGRHRPTDSAYFV